MANEVGGMRRLIKREGVSLRKNLSTKKEIVSILWNFYCITLLNINMLKYIWQHVCLVFKPLVCEPFMHYLYDMLDIR